MKVGLEDNYFFLIFFGGEEDDGFRFQPVLVFRGVDTNKN